MSRSRALPLALSLKPNGNCPPHWRTANDLFWAATYWFTPIIMERLTSLSLSCFKDTLKPLEQEAPRLRELSVIIDNREVILVPLPPQFCANAPLIKLRLHGCVPASWTSSWFSMRLTHLTISGTKHTMHDVRLPFPVEFSRTMASLRCLQHLTLDDFCPFGTDSLHSPTDPYATISLPDSLISFHSLATQMSCENMRLLSNLDLSPDACVSIYSENGTDRGYLTSLMETCYKEAVSNLYHSQTRRALPSELIVTTQCIVTYVTELARASWSTSAEHRSNHSSGSILLAHSQAPWQSGSSRAFSSIPLQHIRAISFEEEILPRNELRERLVTTGDVHRMGVDACDGAAQWLQELAVYKADPGELPRFALFPRLRTVHIHSRKLQDPAELSHTQFMLALLNLVCERRDRGVPLQELVIDEMIFGWAAWDRVKTIMAVSACAFEHSPSRVTVRV